jgi:tetratricopeptide (TPR) repeat protein
MKNSNFPFKSLLVSGAFALTGFISTGAQAQLTNAPVVCPGYEVQPTKIVGERVGKKIQKAFEFYTTDMVSEAIEELRDIKTKNEFDRAYTDRFLGNILAVSKDKDNSKEALALLTRAAEPGVLSALEQSETMRNVADLNLQEQNFEEAIVWYNRWLDYTCKEEPVVYLRIASSYFSSKQMDKVIAPADKAIALYEKPEKNAYILKMSSFVERKMFDEAIDVAETLLQIFPEDQRSWKQLGYYYMQVENYPKALSTFEMAHGQGFLTKENEVKVLAQLYSTNEIPHRAAVIQEKYLDNGLIKTTKESLSAAANSWHQAREYRKAAKFYGQAAKLADDAGLYRKQGGLLLTAEDYKGAVAALEKAVSMGVSNEGQVQMDLMQANFHQGKFKAAYKHMLEAKKDRNAARSARAWESYIKEKAKNRGINI